MSAWVKIKPPGDRRFVSWFHLKVFHFGCLFLAHSHIKNTKQDSVRRACSFARDAIRIDPKLA